MFLREVSNGKKQVRNEKVVVLFWGLAKKESESGETEFAWYTKRLPSLNKVDTALRYVRLRRTTASSAKKGDGVKAEEKYGKSGAAG